MADTRVFDLKGVMCGGCTSAIQDAFDASEFQINAQFDLDSKTVTLTAEASDDEIVLLVEAAGYEATPKA